MRALVIAIALVLAVPGAAQSIRPTPPSSGLPLAGGTLTGALDAPTLVLSETTAPSAAASKAKLYSDSTAHTLKLSLNNGAYSNVLTALTGCELAGCTMVGASTYSGLAIDITTPGNEDLTLDPGGGSGSGSVVISSEDNFTVFADSGLAADLIVATHASTQTAMILNGSGAGGAVGFTNTYSVVGSTADRGATSRSGCLGESITNSGAGSEEVCAYGGGFLVIDQRQAATCADNGSIFGPTLTLGVRELAAGDQEVPREIRVSDLLACLAALLLVAASSMWARLWWRVARARMWGGWPLPLAARDAMRLSFAFVAPPVFAAMALAVVQDDGTLTRLRTGDPRANAVVATLNLDYTSSFLHVTNADADGCEITLLETSAVIGATVRASVISNAGGVVKWKDSANVVAADAVCDTTGVGLGGTAVCDYLDAANDFYTCHCFVP